ncbi:MAG: copper chaperone PCu(A)C [Acetobacteraceae bacterium]|nr:copper chaperone PCu(A)C [Acetobacteraceae bacterium]MSP29430.1 copper chaperone PCu(A)C [Acetobacteraceae bacterium]
MQKIILLLFGLILAALPGTGWAQNFAVRVTDPFARAGAAGRAAAAYMNLQGGPDRLTGVASDAAGRVELHETTMENGIMSMRPVAGVTVSPGAATRLAPGGLHIMLVDLKRPLKEGDMITLELRFERAGKISVVVPVARAGAPTAPDAGGHSRH